jgi:hypothetical protein
MKSIIKSVKPEIKILPLKKRTMTQPGFSVFWHGNLKKCSWYKLNYRHVIQSKTKP